MGFSEQSTDKERWNCSYCDYDLCRSCMAHCGQTPRANCTEAQTPRPTFTAGQTPRAIICTVEQTSRATCTGGHPLLHMSATEQRGQWICDGCGHSSEQSSDKNRWNCSDCDYDLCRSC